MIHCAVYSNDIVVKCAHSASNRTISDFACSVLFGALSFFGFFALPARKCPWESVFERAVKPTYSRFERSSMQEGRFFCVEKGQDRYERTG